MKEYLEQRIKELNKELRWSDYERYICALSSIKELEEALYYLNQLEKQSCQK